MARITHFESPRSPPWYTINTAVIPIIIVTIIVFILQLLTKEGINTLFILNGTDAYLEPWRFVTYMFLHADGMHLFWNMYGLLMFGNLLEQRIGAARFALIYFGSGIIAGLLSAFFYNNALGASGAVMGMLGTLIIVMPDLQLLFFFVIPMKLWMAGVIWIIMDTWGVFFPSGVGNIAHLIGVGVGLLYGLYLKSRQQKVQKKIHKTSHLSENDVEEYMKHGRI